VLEAEILFGDQGPGFEAPEYVIEGEGIELVWDFVETQYDGWISYGLAREGDAAFINGSGDTLYVGNLMWAEISTNTFEEDNAYINVTINGTSLGSAEEFRTYFNLSSISPTDIPDSWKTAHDEYAQEL
jgi:hypothetical protein